MLLPAREGEMSLALLVPPAAAAQGVADDDVDVAAVLKAGVEVQGEVVTVVPNVDRKAASGTGSRWKGERRGQKAEHSHSRRGNIDY